MATASTTTWELTRNQIIEAALRKCGVLAKGQTPATEDYDDCAVALNALVTSLATEGMPLWKRSTTTPALTAGTATYTVSNVWKIAQVVLSDTSSGTQIELTPKSLYDFNRLPDNTSGMPVHYTFAPGLADITLTVWPTPDSGTASTKQLQVVSQTEMSTFSASTETPDFPSYWTEVLIYGLAASVAPEYGVPLQDRQLLEIKYEKLKNKAEGYGDEDGSLYFIPHRRY